MIVSTNNKRLSAVTLGSVVLVLASNVQAEGGGIEEVVVTATRVETLASKTPVAVTAVSGDALRTAGITNPTNLGDLVPSLSIVRNNGLQITIRGITSADNTEKGDPSAGFLLDGVYIARAQAQEVSFFDVQRVEVLRGPQGTLYGRNTTAGLVNVITNKPGFEFESSGSLTYGNYDTRQAEAMVNVPVNDSLALRAAASYDRRDNYLRRNYSAPYTLDPYKDDFSGRLQALIKPSSSLDILLRAEYAQIRGVPFDQVPVGNFFAATTGTADPSLIGGNSQARRSFSLNPTQSMSTDNDSSAFSGEVNWDVGPATITYLGATREFKRKEFGIGLLLPVVANTQTYANYKQDSHELRLATNGDGPFKGQAGIYYFEEHSKINVYLPGLVPGVPVFGFEQGPVVAKSIAYFGQGTYSLTPELRLTAGVRHTRDEKSRLGGTVFQQTYTFNPATDLRLSNAAKKEWGQTTWRLGLDYDLGEHGLLYGVASTGYKAGGFNDGCEAGSVIAGVVCNQPRTPQALYYDPERLRAYEVGLKTRLFDDKASLNAAAFYYDYSNMQLSSVGNCSGAPCGITSNAGKARVKGLELEGIVAPDAANRFDFSLAWLNAEYVEYIAGAARLDYAGRQLDRSPKWTFSAGYAHTTFLDAGAKLIAGLRSRYSDDFVLTAFSTPTQYRQPSYTKTDLSLTYEAQGRRYYVQGFVNNIEDKVIATNISSTGATSISDPRTYGIRVGFKY